MNFYAPGAQVLARVRRAREELPDRQRLFRRCAVARGFTSVSSAIYLLLASSLLKNAAPTAPYGVNYTTLNPR